MDQWPIKNINAFRNVEKALPDLIKGVNVLSFQVNLLDISQVIDIDKFNNYKKLIDVTARVLKVKELKSLKGVIENPIAKEIKYSEFLWIQHVQSSLGDDWEERYKRLGPNYKDNGLRVVGDRISNWLKDNWNQSEYILLPYNHPFTKLLIQYFHYEDHAGIESTLAKLQYKFWVPKSRKVIKSVKSECGKCRM